MTSETHPGSAGENPACPAEQMSFADIVRYLQGGYDEPVQRALAQHVRFCNSCQEAVERVSAMRRSGHANMVSRLVSSENPPSEDEITESMLAAYIDGNLSTDEQDRVGSAISSSYTSYVQFAAARSELTSPPGARYETPRHVMQAMLQPEYQRQAVQASVSAWLDRVADAFSGFLALRWPVPATAFALGMLLMLVVLPKGETIIALPGFTDEVGLYDDSHIRSGLEEPAEAGAIAIPIQRSKRISFSWQPAAFPEPLTYRIDIADAEGNAAIEPLETAEDHVRIDARNLNVDQVYNVSVMAKLPNGGMMPVTNQAIRIVEQN